MNALSQEIETEAKLPKYQQFINSILNKINCGELREGDKLPSIMSCSIEYDLSRDTVGRAYRELFEKGKITCIYRKGYFVCGGRKETEGKRILFVSGQCNTASQLLYNRVAHDLGLFNAECDYMLSHNNLRRLDEILSKETGNYHVIVIEPQLLDQLDIADIINRRGVRSRVILLNDEIGPVAPGVDHVSFSVADEFVSALHKLSQQSRTPYKHLNLVLPEKEYFSSGIVRGFCNYCEGKNLSYEILDEIESVSPGQQYFIVDEHSLFVTIDLMKSTGLLPGIDVGLTALFETQYLQHIFNGITSVNWFNSEVAQHLVNVIINGRAIESSAGTRIQPHVLYRESI